MTAVAPTVRFNAFEILATPTFFFANDLNSRTSDGVHARLVDFFFVDQLLNVGGVVVLDDASWPSIRNVARFIASNRSYKVVGNVGSDEDPRSRLSRDASAETVEADRRLDLTGQCIAFEKTAEDNRQCDHFVEF